MQAYPFTMSFLTDLRVCALSTDGDLRDGSNRPVRCYVTTGGTWALTANMLEGGRIDAGSLAAMQAQPHTVALLFRLGTDAGGNKVVDAVAMGTDGGPPDPGFTP